MHTSLVSPHLDYISNIMEPLLVRGNASVLLRRYKEGPLNLFHYHERPSLQYRRLRMDLTIMTYKILHDTVYLSKDHLFTMNSYKP